MDTFFLPFLAPCIAVITDQGSLVISLFLVGFGGSLAHCAGMCGPFVLSQTASHLQAIPASTMHEMHRITGPLLIPYHLGRMTTYMALGGAGAVFADTLQARMIWPWISAFLMILAGCFFLTQAFPQMKAAFSHWTGTFSLSMGPFSLPSKIMRTLFGAPLGWRGYVLGVTLGFLPCGLLYGAVAAAAATTDPLAGALGMFAFTLGTVPSLVIVGYTGHIAGTLWKRISPICGSLLMGINALILFWIAGRTFF